MPGSINGIGTSYYGKSHLHKVQGQCEFCQNTATLSSYDTIKYFIILFVPVIPLKKLRILSECSACQRHRALPLKDWNQAKDKNIVEVVGQLKENPSDPEVARHAIGVAIGFQDEPLFQATVRSVDTNFTRDASVQSAIGDGQRFFGHLEEAAAAYRKAVDAEDTNERRENLATVLLKLGRSQQAAALLDHIRTPNDIAKVGYLWLLVAGYQAEGMHREALNTLDRIATVTPHVVESKDFKKYKQISERNEASHKRVRSDLLNPKEAAYKEGSLSSRVGPYIGPLIAAALLLAFFGTAFYRGQSRKVYVINGLSIPYTAKINDRSIELNPGSRQVIQISEGEVTVSIESAQIATEPQTVVLTSNFWKRPLFRQTFIINPDRNALIVYEKQYYAKQMNNAPEGEQLLHTGEVLHSFSGLDYEFEQFPATLRTKGGGVISKTRVDTYPVAGKQPVELFAIASEGMGEDERNATEWLRIRQQSDPDNDQWYPLLQQSMTPEAFLEFIKPQLALRPVRVHAHRTYQTSVEQNNPDVDLTAEYTELYKKEPNSGALAYLLGRVEMNNQRSEQLFQSAIKSDPPVAFAAYALGKLRLSQGQFEEALTLTEKALELSPNNFAFEWLRVQCWLSLKKYQPIIDWAGSKDFGLLVGLQVQLIAAQAEALAGIPAESRGAESRLRTMLGQFANPQMMNSFLAKFGEISQYSTAVDESKPVPAGLIEEDAAAMESQAEDEENSTQVSLFQYVQASEAGNKEVAQEKLSKAIAELSRKDARSRKLAQALSVDGQANADDFLQQGDEIEAKRIWLAALAVRYPQDAARYKQLVQKINFERSPPYYWLRAWAAKP